MYFLILSVVKWPEMSYFLEFKGWALVSHWLHAPKKHRSHSTLSKSMRLKLNKSRNSDRHILTVPLDLQVSTVKLMHRNGGCVGV